MTILSDLLSSHVVYRLGWTLLHSLWQCALLAALLALVLQTLRRQSANTRYVASCIGMAIVFVAFVATFLAVTVPEDKQADAATPMTNEQIATAIIPMSTWSRDGEDSIPYHRFVTEFQAAPGADAGPGFRSGDSLPLEPAAHGRSRRPARSVFERLIATLTPWLPWIASVWLVGVFVFSLWNTGGWLTAHRLRLVGTSLVNDEIRRRFHELAERMRVARPVRLLRSTLVEVPVVVGWLRPTVLLPFGLITGLTPSELDAMIIHELAHIRRHDYMVNLLQRLVETLLFYHPAVWWISRRVRIERENCCDDWAVAVTGDRVSYARTLTRFGELRHTNSESLVVGQVVSANGGALLGRVRRLLDRPSSNSDTPLRCTAGVLVLGALCVSTLSLSLYFGWKRTNAAETPRAEEAQPAPATSAPVTTPVPQQPVSKTGAKGSRTTKHQTNQVDGRNDSAAVIHVADTSIAWGEPNGGLRAGLRLFRPVLGADPATKPKPRIRVGQVVDCEVVVENVSGETIQFTSKQVAGPCLRVLSVRDAAGRRVEVGGPAYDGPVGSVRHSLGPGDQVRLPVASCGFAPSFPIYCDARQTTWAPVGPGKYRLSASTSLTGGGLRTGELELEVLPPNKAELTDRVAAALKKRTDEFAFKVVAMTDEQTGLRSLRLLTYEPKGKYPDHWTTVQIDRRQAEAIIQHLAAAGHLWRTVAEPYEEQRFAKPSYFLSVSLGDESEPSRVTDLAPIPLDWGPSTERKLKDLKETLAGDAAAAMGELLGRLRHVRAVESATALAAGQPAENRSTSIETDEIPKLLEAMEAEGADRRAADDADWSNPVGGLRAKIDTSRYLTRRLWMDVCVTVQNVADEPVAIDRGIIHLIDWRVIDAEGRAVEPHLTVNVDVPVEWRQLGHRETIGLGVSNHQSNRGGVLDLVHVVWKLEPGKYELRGTLSGSSKTPDKPPQSRAWSGKIELPAVEFEVIAEISDEQLRAAAKRVRSDHPAGGKPMWEALAALLRPGTSVRQLKMILPPARPHLRPVVTLFNGASFYLVYLLDDQFELEASGIAVGEKPDDLILTSPPRLKPLASQSDGPATGEAVAGLNCRAKPLKTRLPFGEEPQFEVTLANVSDKPLDVIGEARSANVLSGEPYVPCASYKITHGDGHYSIHSLEDPSPNTRAVRIEPGNSWSFVLPSTPKDLAAAGPDQLPSLSALLPGKYTAEVVYSIRDVEKQRHGANLAYGPETGDLAGQKPKKLWEGVARTLPVKFEVLDDGSDQLAMLRAIHAGKGREHLRLELTKKEEIVGGKPRIALQLRARNTGKESLYLGSDYGLIRLGADGEEVPSFSGPRSGTVTVVSPGEVKELGGWGWSWEGKKPGRHTVWVRYVAPKTRALVAESNRLILETPPLPAEKKDDVAWGQPADGLRCGWVQSQGPVAVGAAPKVAVQVENVGGDLVVFECLQEISWAVGPDPRYGPGNFTMPKFQVDCARKARLATYEEVEKLHRIWIPGMKKEEPVPGYYRLEPGGKLTLSAALPWRIQKLGSVKIESWVSRYHSPSGRSTVGMETEMRLPPLVLEVVENEAESEGDKP